MTQVKECTQGSFATEEPQMLQQSNSSDAEEALVPLNSLITSAQVIERPCCGTRSAKGPRFLLLPSAGDTVQCSIKSFGLPCLSSGNRFNCILSWVRRFATTLATVLRRCCAALLVERGKGATACGSKFQQPYPTVGDGLVQRMYNWDIWFAFQSQVAAFTVLLLIG